MIPDRDLEVLRSFDSRGRVTLSAYLRLDTPQHRESSPKLCVQQMLARMEECKPRTECQEAIKEDIEIVQLYLKTNGHRQHSSLAIFSCAAEYFWRAYCLPLPIPTQVQVGPHFYLKPLLQFSGAAA